MKEIVDVIESYLLAATFAILMNMFYLFDKMGWATFFLIMAIICLIMAKAEHSSLK